MKVMIAILGSGFGIDRDSRIIEIRIGIYRDHAGYGVYEGHDWVSMKDRIWDTWRLS